MFVLKPWCRKSNQFSGIQRDGLVFKGLWLHRVRWLIPSGCGSKVRGTELESRSGRMFVIEVVHNTLLTMHFLEPLKQFDKSRGYSLLRASLCRAIAMIVQKAT